jgi:hypothetical protein
LTGRYIMGRCLRLSQELCSKVGMGNVNQC